MSATPNPAYVAASVAAAKCPYCGRGPFRSLAKHTWQAHRITADAIRALLGWKARKPLCTPAHSAELRAVLDPKPAQDKAKRLRTEIREEVRAAWLGSSQDHAALAELAQRHGVAVQTMRDFIRNSGLSVPSTLSRRPRGRRSLTVEQARAAREAYLRGEATQPELAKRYGVSSSLISRACVGHLYGDLEAL